MIERDIDAARRSKVDQPARHAGRDDGLAALVVGDAGLPDTNALGQLLLAQTELCADGLDSTHPRIIAPTVEHVNGGAVCAVRARILG